MRKKNLDKKNRKTRWTRPAIALSLAAILFGAGNAFAQSPGYILKNGDPTPYSTLDAVHPGNGDTLTIYDGDVTMGGSQLSYGGDTTLTIQSDVHTIRIIDAEETSRFFGSTANYADLTLNLDSVTFTGGKSGGTGGVIYQDNSSQTATINGTNTTFLSNSATSGGVYDGYNIAINGSNTFSGNTATENYGGVFYTHSAEISGANKFTNNSANTAGGVIRATQVTFKGNGSSATFTANYAHGVKNDLSIISFSDAVGSVTIQDAGTYSFGGGITAAAENTGITTSTSRTVRTSPSALAPSRM